MPQVPEPTPPLSALALGMVKNEADIVEAFVRHNLHFVDLMVLLDNGSTDGTRDILEALQKEGLPLLVIDDPVFGYFQSEKMTELYRRTVPVFQPEVVYLLDADEFMRAPDRAAMDGLMRQVPAGAQALLPWMTHTPDPQRSSAELLSDPLASSPWRRAKEEPQYYKSIIRRCPSLDADLVIDQGNHSVHRASGQPMPTAVLSGVHLAHLPVRSVEQVTAKAINGWLAYLVRNRHTRGEMQGSQWQLLYERITQGTPLRADDLTTLSLDYAQHPRPGRSLQADALRDPCPPRHGVLKYLDLGRHDPVAKVALGVAQHLQADDMGAVSAATPGPLAHLPIDVAAVRCVSRMLGIRSYFSPSSHWLQAMGKLWPECALADRSCAQALLLPDLVASDLQRWLGAYEPRADRRVLGWLPANHSAADMEAALAAFAQSGWDPEPISTLGLRAVSVYGFMRRGALVMRPRRTENAANANAMTASLRAMSAAAHAWSDPRPQWIAHALQNLRLGAPPDITPAPVQARASVLFGAAKPRLQRSGQPA